jgi:hypothetical protein
MSPESIVSGITEGDREIILLMASFVPEDLSVAALIRDTISWSATYDHILDGDEWTPGHLHQMIETFLIGLPTNAFYRKHESVLMVILLNAISAWKYAETNPAYRVKVADGISELGCACLLLSGGTARLNKHGAEWREASLKLLKQSDERK